MHPQIILLSLCILKISTESTESIITNTLKHGDLNSCLKTESRSKDLGYCFGSEILQTLNSFDEKESFSLVNGIEFVYDEKTPRNIGAFLERDPLDFRGIMEGASSLISRRSLHWDLSRFYPGLMMRIGPTLANGVLEFIIDPRYKDRTFQGDENHLSTGRLLAKNFLIPLLLGFKFQMSTLLPILLALILLASKKAFLLSKIAIAVATIFGFGSTSNYANGGGYYGGPALSTYSAEYVAEPSFIHGSGQHGHFDNHPGFYNHHRPQPEYYFKEKASQQMNEEVTGSPITPIELKDHLERLFITKNDEINPPMKDPRDNNKYRDGRRYVWSKIQ